ncbi:hypothetical protein TNCV_4008781 [Trichonephila clavipes]|nr:hypothetical protein TNCV_4008781 [Trichonephila clavipes]
MNLCGTRTPPPPCFSMEVKEFWHKHHFQLLGTVKSLKADVYFLFEALLIPKKGTPSNEQSLHHRMCDVPDQRGQWD